MVCLVALTLGACETQDSSRGNGGLQPPMQGTMDTTGAPRLPEPGFAPLAGPEPPEIGARVSGAGGTSFDPMALPSDNQGRTQVAMLLPLSGRQAALGKAMQDAAQLALFSVADPSFELVFEDTGGSPQGAHDAARRALAKGARLILGPLLGTSVRAVAPLARQADVNVIAFSTDRTVAGAGVFVMGFLPRIEIERVVDYALAQGMKRFAVLAPRTAYGEVVVNEYSRIVQMAGGRVTATAFYDDNAKDYSKVVRAFAKYDSRTDDLRRQLQNLDQRDDEVAARAREKLQGRQTAGGLAFDVLLLPDGGRRLLALAPLLPFYDVDQRRVQFIGTGAWDDPNLWTEPALRGGWFAASEPGARQDFVSQYQETYGRQPPRLATLAYDAAALAAVLAWGGPNGFTTSRITNASGFVGADGIFRFSPSGLIERGLAVLEVVPSGPRVVDPAPKDFRGLTN